VYDDVERSGPSVGVNYLVRTEIRNSNGTLFDRCLKPIRRPADISAVQFCTCRIYREK
jgi:hypothetical protein